MLLPAHKRYGPRPGEASKLESKEPDPTRRSGDKHALPNESPALLESVQRRQTRDRQRCRLLERDTFRKLRERVCRHRHALGPRPRGEETNHPRTLARPAPVCGALPDRPGQVPPWAEARFGLL